MPLVRPAFLRSTLLAVSAGGLLIPPAPFAAEPSGVTAVKASSPQALDFPAAAKLRMASAPGMVPSLATASSGSFKTLVSVNGFPSEVLGSLGLSAEMAEEVDADYQRVTPLHPYFLKAGENRLRVEYAFAADATPGSAPLPYQFRIAATLWDYVANDTNQELSRWTSPAFPDAASAKPGVLEGPFVWNTTLPAWGWTKGSPIENSPATLAAVAAETRRLWTEITSLHGAPAGQADALRSRLAASTAEFQSACGLRGKPSGFLDLLLQSAASRALPGAAAGSLAPSELPADADLTLQVFAGGTLAKVSSKSGHPVLALTSTLDDGPRGMPNEVRLRCDAWFRKAADGTWQVDALYPRTAPGTWSSFSLQGRNLGELFRLSCF